MTQLELELQAEVDKFVLCLEVSNDSAQRLLDRMFDSPRFLDAEGTEAGERYRLAHRLAARFGSARDRGQRSRAGAGETALVLSRGANREDPPRVGGLELRCERAR